MFNKGITKSRCSAECDERKIPCRPVDEWGSPGHFAHKALEEDVLEVALRRRRHLAHHAAVVGSLHLGHTTTRGIINVNACEQFGGRKDHLVKY